MSAKVQAEIIKVCRLIGGRPIGVRYGSGECWMVNLQTYEMMAGTMSPEAFREMGRRGYWEHSKGNVYALKAYSVTPEDRGWGHVSTQPCCMYLLIDPRDGIPFYVGISRSPVKRAAEHAHNPTSAAYSRVRKLRSEGIRFEFMVDEYQWFYRRQDALDAEFRMIQENPQFLNKDKSRTRLVKTKVGDEID